MRDPLDQSAPQVAFDPGVAGSRDHRHVRDRRQRRRLEPRALDARDRAHRRHALRDARAGVRAGQRDARDARPVAVRRRASTSCGSPRPTSPAAAPRRRRSSSSPGHVHRAASSAPSPTSRPTSAARRSPSRASYDSFAAYDTGSFGAGWTLVWRDLRLDTDVSRRTDAPLRSGSRVIVDTPDGGRAAFTFAPEQVTGNGFTLFPAEVGAGSGRHMAARVRVGAAAACGAGSSTLLADGSAVQPGAVRARRSTAGHALGVRRRRRRLLDHVRDAA